MQADLFSLRPRKYPNSLRAKSILQVSDGTPLCEVAKMNSISSDLLKRWISAYGHYPRKVLDDVAVGMYDSPDHFLIEMEALSPYSYYFYHAIECVLAGMQPIEFAELITGLDPLEFESVVDRVKKIPHDQLSDLRHHRIKLTPVKYDSIIQNLRRATKALAEAANHPNAEPILDSETQQLDEITRTLLWLTDTYFSSTPSCKRLNSLSDETLTTKSSIPSDSTT